MKNRLYVMASCFASLATALGVYLGAYLLIVERVPAGVVGSAGWSCELFEAQYSENNAVDEWLARTFEPLHSLDQKIRPNYWKREKTHNVDLSKYSSP